MVLVRMELALQVNKEAETEHGCVYSFGSPQNTAGRARIDKSSGDIELLEMEEMGDGPSKQFYLAHLIPRLQDYHERETYPPDDRWSL